MLFVWGFCVLLIQSCALKRVETFAQAALLTTYGMASEVTMPNEKSILTMLLGLFGFPIGIRSNYSLRISEIGGAIWADSWSCICTVYYVVLFIIHDTIAALARIVVFVCLFVFFAGLCSPKRKLSWYSYGLILILCAVDIYLCHLSTILMVKTWFHCGI